MEFAFNTDGERQSILEELTVRPYQAGDEHRILPAFNAVFGLERDLRYWRWAFVENPQGTRVHLALTGDGEIAGHWAGIPVRVKTPWGERCFVQIVDTFVHPGFRKGRHDGPGVFAVTGESGIKRWMGELGDAVLYGYPMPRAEKMGRRFLGYRRLCVVDYLCRPIGKSRAKRTTVAQQSPGRVEIERVATLDAGIEGLHAELARIESCLLVRDRRYLQWRYVEHPHDPYEIYTARRGGELAGLMVLRPQHETIANVCTIAEWLVPARHPDVVAALLATAEARGRQLDRWAVLAVFADGSPEFESFLKHGFQVVPSSTIRERRLTVWNGPSFPELDDAFLAEHWWYSIGDSDLV